MKSASITIFKTTLLVFALAVFLVLFVHPFTIRATAQSASFDPNTLGKNISTKQSVQDMEFVYVGKLLANTFEDLISDGNDGDQFVFGGTYTLEEGETLEGDLLVIGGAATLEADSIVRGDIVVMGGTLKVGGIVQGDIFTLGGLIHLEEPATVEGDVGALAGNLEYMDRDQIAGEVFNGDVGPLQSNFSENFDLPRLDVPNFQAGFNPLWEILWSIFQSIIWAALAVLVVLLFPQPVSRTAHTSVSQPIISAGLGLLTVFVAPGILLVITITIIGIPIALLGIISLIIAWSLGMVAIGYEIGNRMAKMLNSDWAPAVSAGIGVFILTVVSNVPCIGWMVSVAVGLIGLGGVILTRFGTRSYPPDPITESNSQLTGTLSESYFEKAVSNISPEENVGQLEGEDLIPTSNRESGIAEESVD